VKNPVAQTGFPVVERRSAAAWPPAWRGGAGTDTGGSIRQRLVLREFRDDGKLWPRFEIRIDRLRVLARSDWAVCQQREDVAAILQVIAGRDPTIRLQQLRRCQRMAQK